MKSRDSGKTIPPSALPAYTLHARKSVVIFQYDRHLLKAFVQFHSPAA